MTQLFVNNFSTTLSQTFGVSDTFMHLTSVTGLPAINGGNYLLLTVFRKVGVEESGHEVVRATAITGNQLTVVRAVEGAAASIFNIGDLVEARVTAASLGAKADVVDAYVHPANHPAAVITQDANNRFVTDAEKTAWNDKQPAGNYATGGGTATGANTGDQASIVGITGTLAQFNSAITDADLVSLNGSEALTNKTLTGYTETVYALAGTVIDVANGTVQTKTLAANTTFTESLADGQSVILGITAGAYSVTWPTTTWVKVGGSGTAPTLTSTGVNWVILWQVGGTLRGAFLGTA